MNKGKTVLVFMGAKGGVGTSTIAGNLALVAAEKYEGRAVLVDWSAGRDGGVETLFGRPVSDKRRGLVVVKGFDIPQPASNGQPTTTFTQQWELLVPGEEVTTFIVDGGTSDLPNALLQEAHRVVLVGTPDVPSVRGLQTLVRSLSARLETLERVALVVNRVRPHSDIAVSDVQSAAGCPTLVAIPEDDQPVRQAANLGGGFVHTPSSAAKAIERLAEKIFSGKGVPGRTLSAKNAVDKGNLPGFGDFRRGLHVRVIAKLTGMADDPSALSREDLERVVTATVEETAEAQLLPREDRHRLVRDTVDELAGLGPLERYLEDSSVTEIMVNGHRQLYVEREGRIQKAEVGFSSDEQVLRVIERIIGPQGRRIDESSPMVDTRLPDGSRVNAIIPPLSVDGPLLTIRKFPSGPLALEDLVRLGTLSKEMAEYLAESVQDRKNVIIAGGTGSGKTTLLNALSGCIPGTERIITIEDAAELRLQQEHVARLEARPPNIEGQGAVTIRDLVRNALRMRPDRIIVGEVRGGEALDMLQAMNTGHAGSMSTVHANSTRDALLRLETMVMMAGMDLPVRVIRDQLVAALNLMVHLERERDGSRKVTSIAEVVGIEDGVIILKDCFVHETKLSAKPHKGSERNQDRTRDRCGQGVA